MSSSVEQNIGSITAFSYSAIPSSYLVCDGSAVSRTTYSALFAKIGTTYGSGDGSTTFNLPDLRGEFIRGLDLGRGVDTGRALGTSQTDDFKSHNHSLSSNQLSVSTGTANDNLNNVSTGANRYGLIQTVTIGNTGGTETRPRNIAMVYAIKAKESAVISSSESQTIQNLITASEPWYSTTTGTGATTVTENIYHSGNVGIGTTSPDASAVLELNSTNKGLLIPRVALSSTSSASPLSSHVQGMIVYNTATAADVTPGQYFNNGTEWRKVVTSSNPSPQLVLLAKGNGVNDNSTSLNWAAAKIAFFKSTIINRDGAAWDANTSIYTAPKAGYYMINANLFLSSCPSVTTVTTTFRVALSNQGSGAAEIYISGGQTVPASLSSTVYLNTGDKVWIDYNYNNAGYCSTNLGDSQRLTIYRIE
ncbi:phage tail protein [Chryseobacterium sp. SG20098]|uniref:phage tail protein n=1 Tax=Chryseobacterium sp. SG20098 TaxID=3074145 RepID=UPI002882E12E|nr:phage tail protein [Chryseobacterium sp. SG20098]WNI36450.1 phage tail protein [Chryseobacterium sp. SG20098]